jgi:hypothetical protein
VPSLAALVALVATLLRLRARACVVLACVAAMLCVAANAPALESAQTKTRVWDFSFATALNIRSSALPSPEQRPGFSPAQAKLASESPHAARGLPTLSKALPGLAKADAQIIGRAAEIAKGAKPGFANDLAALCRATTEANPAWKVYQLGEHAGSPIYGSVGTRVGIVSSSEGTLLVRAPTGGNVEVLGLFR